MKAKTSKSGRVYFRLGAEDILVARTRRKKDKKIACPLLDVFACGQVSSPRLYRLKMVTIQDVTLRSINEFRLVLDI